MLSASCLVQAVSFSLPTLSIACATFARCRLFAFPWTASDNFCEASEINYLVVSCSAVCAISSCAGSANCSCKCFLVLWSTLLASSASSSFFFYSSSSSNACLHWFSRKSEYSESARLTACMKSFVMGTSIQEPNKWIASFTTQRATTLCSDNDPCSLVTRALFTENPVHEMHWYCESVSAALAI